MPLREPVWDDVNNVEVRTIDGASDVSHDAEADIQYVVLPEEGASLPLRCLYAPSASDTLVVSFHGSLQRTKYQLPRFEWRRTLERLDVGALMIADSTLELNDSMPLSWFVGTEKEDLAADLAKFIGEMAATGGYSRIILAGSSGGGFAAMAVSSRLPGSAAVSFSPQTRIGDYVPWVYRKFAATAFPRFDSIEAVESAYPGRVNLRSLYSRNETTNFVRYVQNAHDPDHVESHFTPFAQCMGIDPALGGTDASGRIKLLLEPLGKGHQPPPRGRFIRHLRAAHEEFFGSKIRQHGPNRDSPGAGSAPTAVCQPST